MPERKAEVILKIAQAIGNQLGISELLASLTEALHPIIHFDATGIVTLEGDAVTVHWAHLDELVPSAGESVEGVVGRYASRINVEPPPMKIPVSDHPISVIMKTGQPYIATDLAVERGFDTDEPLLNMGFSSYIDLPLVNQGALIGTIKFLSREKANFTIAQLGLLQDISNVVAIAVSNALAYEEIKSLKEQLQLENQVLQEQIVERSIYEEIVGSSGALQKVVTAIEQVAPTISTVLITGETGTGKELVAHAIHRRSPRSDRALVKVNCAALPAELIASELFGHEKSRSPAPCNNASGDSKLLTAGPSFSMRSPN